MVPSTLTYLMPFVAEITYSSIIDIACAYRSIIGVKGHGDAMANFYFILCVAAVLSVIPREYAHAFPAYTIRLRTHVAIHPRLYFVVRPVRTSDPCRIIRLPRREQVCNGRATWWCR